MTVLRLLAALAVLAVFVLAFVFAMVCGVREVAFELLHTSWRDLGRFAVLLAGVLAAVGVVLWSFRTIEKAIGERGRV